MKVNRKQTYGEVFTLPGVVSYMLDRLGYVATKDLSQICILEPAAGKGAFVLEIVKRLKMSSKVFGFKASEALGNVWAVEISSDNIQSIKERLVRECSLDKADLQSLHIIKDDFLFWDIEERFDVIVGNPPYVRWDNLDGSYRNQIRNNYKTFRGRADLYIAFYERCLGLLAQDGQLSFICSNRWFKASYGMRLRELVSLSFAMLEIVDMENLNPFTEKVNGYPVITTIQNRVPSKPISYFKAIHLNELYNVPNYRRLDQSLLNRDIWTFVAKYSDLSKKEFYRKIEDCSYKIKIGIATGKDTVFIGTNLETQIEHDRLVPLVKANQIGKESDDSQYQVINCFDDRGFLIDLDNYPRLKAYFEIHSQQLRARHIARKKPAAWFRTIDKIRQKDINVSKILLPDITGSKSIYLGGEGYYPHHNLYYITSSLGKEHLEVLAAVLTSKFIKDQLFSISTRMNGGYPRWQAQNLRRLIVPDITAMSLEWKKTMISSYRNDDQAEIDKLMAVKIIENEFQPSNQLVLF